MLDRIKWLGHASVRIEAEKVIYIDPWKIGDTPKADLILITHSHYDHFSPDDIRKIQKEDTVIIAAADLENKLSGNVQFLKPGDRTKAQGIEVEAVPAYNMNKSFHPRENNWLGFVLNVEGTAIYHSGDTDVIPEMKHIRADIWMLPVGGTYTMTAQEAAAAVNGIRPGMVIPIHCGDLVGTFDDAGTFKELCETPVEIKAVTT